MPSASLYSVDLSSTYAAIGATTLDSAASVAAFQAAHSFSVNIGGSFTVDLERYRYVLVVIAEQLANSLIGGQLLGINLDMDVTEQAEV
jgi:hypothetical protein